MIEFREYEKDDFSDVKNLIQEAFNIESVEADDDPNVYRLVGVKDGSVVSYLDITFSFDVIKNFKYAFINYVCVSSKARGFGIGTKMMEEAIRICREKNVVEVKLTSNKKRCQARSIYGKLGFEIKDTDLFVKVI